MFARILMSICTISAFSHTLDAALVDGVVGLFQKKSQESVPTIDVLVVHDQPEVMFEVRGKYYIYDPHNHQHMGTRLFGKRKNLQTLPTGIKWGEEFPGTYQIKIIPELSSTISSINGIEYKGIMTIYDIGGSLSIVNQVDLENFIASLLVPQFQVEMPQEALAAVAIAARSFAYNRAQHPKTPYWAVDSQQVGYIGRSNANPENVSAIERAIESTRNMVLSTTSAYEGQISAVPAQWGTTVGIVGHEPVAFSKITLHEAEEMARNGAHAAQILSKAFPDAHIELIK